MNIDFWYSNISGGTGIQTLIEKLGLSLFKDIEVDVPNKKNINFLVFQWETSNAINPINQYQTHSDEFISLLKKLQNEGFYFIADFSTEAHSNTDSLSLEFLNILNRNQIDLKRLILAKNDSSTTHLRKIKYGNYYLNTCFFPHFFINTFYKMQEYVIPRTDVVKDKIFLCLNRRLHTHKYLVLENLHKRGLLDETYYTAVKSYTKLTNNGFIKELPIQLDGDIMYGEGLESADEYLYTINPMWYYKSKVNLITETIFYENSIHITEKTWKAIYLGVPFVICASTNHLNNIHKFGFKTFGSLIDESYDSDLDYVGKIPKIIDSGLELAKLTNTEEVESIVEFNKSLYFDENHTKMVAKTMFLDEIVKINTQISALI